MELRHLRYFVAVAEEQNITRAAARLHVSQPPLSRQIRDLEDELGVALLEHKAKSVRLTEAGRVFLEEARAVLRRTEQALQTARAVGKGQSGQIHVAYAPSLTVEILPLILRGFQEAMPGVRVILHDLSTEEMLQGLQNGKLQASLMISPGAKALRGLIFEELRRYRVCLATHPAHPLAQKPKVPLAELAGERLIAYSRQDYPEYHESLAQMLKGVEPAASVSEEHDSATSLIAAVEAGRGVALVPECLACLAGPRLKFAPLAPPPAAMVVGVARPKGTPSRAVETFLAVARKNKTTHGPEQKI